MTINFKRELCAAIREEHDKDADAILLERIAKMHEAPTELISLMIEWGINVEMEHANDYDTAKDVVMENITEDPLYYKKLMDLDI